ncbi:hypothetical protein PISMIDRAFT_10209 [Pisolithus microcarpus 441]|uniref:Uncharacterized protein n=1 Tax=Pisolithus microcarpus 441 TaxID=765257 RepID=A0A0C9Z620_9AGAM|nr:hypothetical protein PISMIDRAFT_10209 [Pisolithus microcarpus 441]
MATYGDKAGGVESATEQQPGETEDGEPEPGVVRGSGDSVNWVSVDVDIEA